MKVIELTGGVGAGKSRILELLQTRYKAEILQADQTARELQKKGEAGYQGILNVFGTEILGEDGELNREKLASLIFSDDRALEKINGIIHPLVWQRIHDLAQLAREKGNGLFVVETAIPDKNPDDIYDEVWYVYTLDIVRLKRLLDNRGYSREKALRIMANQLTNEQYRAGADFVIDNNGSLKEVEKQIEDRLFL